jgi:DNA-binding transcriptional ArsR family regulator
MMGSSIQYPADESERESSGVGSTGETEPESSEVESAGRLSEDEAFEVLSNPRRRYSLHFLVESGETELGELAEHVAAWENDKGVHELSTGERKCVYSALQQSHLPKMDDTGVVEFDKDRGTIDPSDAVAELDIYLEVVRGNEIPWSEYYVGLSAVGTALVGALWLGAYPFTMLSNVAWAAFLTTAFGVSALVHHYYARQMKLGAGESPPDVE